MQFDDDRWGQLVDNCLSQVAPGEVALLGDEYVKRVVELVTTGQVPRLETEEEGGLPNDIVQSIKFVFDVVSFLKTAIDIYLLLKDRLGHLPSRPEMETSLSKVTSRVPTTSREIIIKQVLRVSVEDNN